MAARLLSWYLLITVLFRCPSSISELSDSSPKVCKPYLDLRSYASPHVDPYYQAYLAPHVDKLRPHVDTFNKNMYIPAATFTVAKYNTYGARRVEQAKAYVLTEWDKAVKPQLDIAQTKGKAQYDLYLAPRIKQTSEVVAPYYETTKTTVLDKYQHVLIPAYQAALPYAQKGFAQCHHIAVDFVFPYVRFARDSSFTFLSRTVWPQLSLLYYDNVEPQLVRISERLGRYKDGKKMEAAADSVEVAAALESLSSQIAASSSSSASLTETVSGTVVTKSAKPSETLTPEELQEKLQGDLRKWQTKFAVAADKGSEDLEERVKDITDRQIKSAQAIGKALLVQLEEKSKHTIADLKSTIKKAVKTVPKEPTEEELEAHYEQVVAATRAAGTAIKEKAQAVRTWRGSYDAETDNLVKDATASTVKILDNIQDLGLQEIGMRWAWTDGVTYKNWAKYHELKNTLEEWRNEVEFVGSRHEGLKAAHDESTSIEDQAMAIAEDTAKELVRLKDVAKWKIWAEDSTDDFSSKKVPARVFKAAEVVMEKVEDTASQVSEAVVGSETPATESIASAAKESAESVSSKISEAVIGTEPNVAEKAATAVSEAVIGSSAATDSISSAASSVASEASAAGESVISAAKYKSDQVKEDIIGTPAPPLSQASANIESAASVASEAPKKVWGGAIAQKVEAREIVLDDIIDDSDEASFSEKLQSAVSVAGDRAAALTSAIEEALKPATTTQGGVESVTSLASEQYEKALSAASSVLYGTEQGAVESVSSVAAEKYAQAVTAASYAVYGTPTPVLESIQSAASSGYANAQGVLESISAVAASRLSEGLSLASAQYSSAKIAVGVEPTPASQKYMAEAQRRYYEGIGLAHARYSEFVEAASTAVYGTPTPYHEALLSSAQGRYSAAIAAASSNLDSVLNAVSAPAQSVIDAASSQYSSVAFHASASLAQASFKASEAIYGTQQGTFESIGSVVSESGASITSRASKAVIGTETPWTESVAAQASENWAALISKASEQVYGAPTPFAESFYSQAGAYGAQATDAAASQYAAMSNLISELVVGKEPDFTESIMLKFSSAYYTGYPAYASSASSIAVAASSVASSVASEHVEAASSYVSDAYASASSVVTSVFTPPPALEAALDSAQSQLNAAVEAASVQVYGTEKGTIEQAASAAASAYSSVQSRASEAVYGTQPSYLEAAQASFADVASSAQDAISAALYGTPTGTVESLTSGAASVYSSVSSVAADKAAKVSEAVYGPEKSAMESAEARLMAAVESARAKIQELVENGLPEQIEVARQKVEKFAANLKKSAGEAADEAKGGAEDAYSKVSSVVGEAAGSVSSVAAEATQRVRDEL